MSGADLSADDIANGVFHALYPECPAFPGVPNACDTQICDCFNADRLPEKVERMAEALQKIRDIAFDYSDVYCTHEVWWKKMKEIEALTRVVPTWA